MNAKTIVFVHGMFMTPTCWKKWEDYFQARGYHPLAPAWPEHDLAAAAERARHPNPALAKLELAGVLAHYRKIIASLDEKPILIGHSMGGLVVELLLQEGLGVAGVAIDPAPPKGVITLKWSFLKSNWPLINPFASRNKPVVMDEKAFHYAFANTLTADQSNATWQAEVVPESRRVGKAPTTAVAKIDFHHEHPPLLFIAGEKDHVVPAVLVQKAFRHYQGPSLTAFKQFPGRDHTLIFSEGWQEIADYVATWLDAPAP